MKRIPLLLFTVILVVAMTMVSFASVYDLYGYTTGTFSVNLTARSNEYCFVNLHFTKDGETIWKTAKLTFNVTNATNKSGTVALRTELLNNARSFKITSDNTSVVKVETPKTTLKTNEMNSAVNNPDGYYIYLWVPITMTIPRGYEATSQNHAWDEANFPVAPALWIYNNEARNSNQISWTSSNGTGRGPFAQDTQVTKYLNINVLSAAGVIQRYAKPGSPNAGKGAYSMDSLNIRLKPNVTTVKFDANTGTGTMSNQTVTYDKNAPIKANEFVKPGYHFTGWNTEADGSGTSFADGANVTTQWPTEDDVTLYAQWVPNDYTLKFNPLGGTTDNTDTTVTHDSNNNATVGVAEREGYVFTGWYTMPFGGYQLYDEEGIASDHGNGGYWSGSGSDATWATPMDDGTEIQLYAHWEPKIDGGYVVVNNEKETTAPGTLGIKKIDDTTGDVIQGVGFLLTGPNSYSESKVTSTDGTAKWENLQDGEYTLVETSWPSDYKELAEMRDGVHPYKVVVQDGKVTVFAVKN